MKTLKNSLRCGLIVGAGLATLAATGVTSATAQTITPMRQLVTSYEDQFALRVMPKNPYQHRIRMEVRVYDQNFRLIKARVAPRSMMLGAGAGRSVTVTVPFEGQTTRKIRICAESTPFPQNKTVIRARVCGRFLARRVR